MQLHLPIKARLTLAFAVLMLVVLAGLGVFLYFGFAHQVDKDINDQIEALAREFTADIAAGETRVLEDFGAEQPEDSFAQILDRNGGILETTSAVTVPILDSAELKGLTTPRLLEKTIRFTSGVDPARLLVTPTERGPVLIIGMKLDDRNAVLDRLAALLWIGGPVFLILVTGLAWFLSREALRPVERLRLEAAAISEGDLEKRLPVPTTADEIANLAATLNEMLARLERAFEKEHRFVDDASHELRTPIGILKTELELARRGSRTKVELEAAVASAAEQTERLSRLSEDLLILARSDRAKLPLHKTKVDASILLNGIAESFRGRAREQGVTIDTSVPGGLEIEVDESRIRQMLANLIANSLAHTPEGGNVRVSLVLDQAQRLVFSVADTGRGFPDAFIERAFDPFTRAEAARSRRDGGTGLGLAIVKGVVEAHGGSVKAENQPEGGAVVTLQIPS